MDDSIAEGPHEVRTLAELVADLGSGAGPEQLGLIVGPRAPKRLVDALLVLARNQLRAFSVRIGSDADAHRLIEIDPRREEVLAAFFDALAPPGRALAELAAKRLSRIDDELTCTAEEGGLRWRFRGQPLASMRGSGDALEADVGTGRERRRLHEEHDVERFVERALLEYLAALESLRARSRRHEERAEMPELFVRGPLLSAEELAAFRD